MLVLVLSQQKQPCWSMGRGKSQEFSKNKKPLGERKTQREVSFFKRLSYKVVGGEVTMIKSEKKWSVMLQYSLFTKSNYATWSVMMRVNLKVQGVQDTIEHGNVQEHKDRITLAVIYQEISEDLLPCWQRWIRQRQHDRRCKQCM